MVLWPVIDNKSKEFVLAALKTGKLSISSSNINSPSYVLLAENKLKSFFKFKEAILTNSGSNSITIALQGLGIKKGDYVLVSSLTWVGCYTSIIRIGAIPVFVDSKTNELTLDFDSCSIQPKAILVTHSYASLVNISRLKDRFPNAHIIEDCSHTTTTLMKDSSRTNGDVVIFSLQASKALTAGEGGVILLNNKGLANMMRALRMDGRNYENVLGIYGTLVSSEYHGANHNLSDLNAGFLCDQLEKYRRQCDERSKNARAFIKYLKFDHLKPIFSVDCIDSGMFYGIPLKTPNTIIAKEFAAKFKDELELENSFIYPSVTENNLFNPSSIPAYKELYSSTEKQSFINSQNISELTLMIPHQYFLDINFHKLHRYMSDEFEIYNHKSSENDSKESITVIILTKNRKQFLNKALDSVFTQKGNLDIEILLLADNEPSLRKRQVPDNIKLNYFSLLSEESFQNIPTVKRVATLRNIALKIVNTKYVCFLDDDNYWSPNHLTSLVKTIKDSNSLAVYSQRKLLTNEGEPWIPSEFPWTTGDIRKNEELFEIYLKAGLLDRSNNLLKDSAYLYNNGVDYGTVDMGAWLFNFNLFDIINFEVDYSDDEIKSTTTEDDKLLTTIKELNIKTICSEKQTLNYRLGGYSNKKI